MAFNLFLNPTSIEGRQAKAAEMIRSEVAKTGAALKASYALLRKLVHSNPDKLTADQVYAGLGADDAAALKTLAVLVKTIANKVKPGSIDDDVPVATLDMPKG